MAADDLVLDLTNYKDTIGNYVPPGRYAVVVEDAELGESSNKKTPQLTLWLRVAGGDYDGSTLVEALYLTDSSKFRVVAFLQALSIKTPRAKLSFKLKQFISRRLYVIVEDDVYNGKTRSRVTAFERYVTATGEASNVMEDLEEFAGTDAEAVDLPDEEEIAAPPAVATVTAGTPVESSESKKVEVAPAAAAVVSTEAPPVPSDPTPAPAQAAAVAAPAVAEDDDEGGIDLDDLDL